MIVLKLLKLVAQLLAIGIFFFLPSIYPRIRVIPLASFKTLFSLVGTGFHKSATHAASNGSGSRHG